MSLATGANRSISSVAFTPDSKTLAAGGLSFNKATDSFGGVLELWNPKTGAKISTLNTAANGGVFSVAFSLDGKVLAVGGTGVSGGVLELWNVSTGALASTLQTSADSGVTSIAFSKDGKTFAVGGYNESGQENGVVELWNAVTGTRIASLNAGAEEGVLSVAFSADGSTLFVGTSGNMQAFSVQGHTLLEQYSVGQVSSVSVSPDGTLLAYGTENGEVGVALVPTFTAVTVTGLTISPTTIPGGETASGTVTIAQPAPTGGVFVALSSNSPSAGVPAELNIAGGATSATFTVTTKGVDSQTTATITAGNSTASKSVALTITPATLLSVTASPSSVTGGISTTGTVTLTGKAGPSGVIVTLTSSVASVVVPKTVTLSAGLTFVTFPVTTTAVSVLETARITAKAGKASQTTSVTVDPPTIQAVAVNPSPTYGGTACTGIVSLSSPAGPGDLKVTLQSSLSTVVVPASVTVAANQTSVSFTVKTSAVSAQKLATITAKFNGGTETTTLTINPPTIVALTLNPASIKGGKSSIATLSVSSPAPAGGLKVSVASSQSAATTPATVTVPAGKTSVTFTIKTKTVKSSTTASISATLGSVSKSAALTIS